MESLPRRHAPWKGWAGSWGTLVRPTVRLAPKTGLARSSNRRSLRPGGRGRGWCVVRDTGDRGCGPAVPRRVRSEVRRLGCPRCGVGRALLPEDLCAHRDVTFAEVESALKVGVQSGGAKASGQDGSTVGRRVRRLPRRAGAPRAPAGRGFLGAGV